jgi:EAL domain-containing protein (putative c-di-GMP-specific phosphodiesterase class I)
MTSSTRRDAAESSTRSWTVDAVIDDRAIRTQFQPVVHLESRTLVGFEALSRGPAGSPLASPTSLISAARRVGRLGELDWLCRVHAMQAAADARLSRSLSWLINVEPAGLEMDCPPHLQIGLDRARTELRVILEVVEREMHGYVVDLLRATDQARRDPWGVALDDIGAEEASLALLPLLRPDVVKLDIALLAKLSRKNASVVNAAVRAYAEQTGAVIIAEGIETLQQEQTARVFGASYGQGYLFGRPGRLPAAVPEPRHAIPLRQVVAPLDGRTPFDLLSIAKPPARASRDYVRDISDHLESKGAYGEHPSVLLARFEDPGYFTGSIIEQYRRLARANALTIVLGEGIELHDEPRFHVGCLPPRSRMRREWIVIVLNPHYAAAFVARERGQAGAQGEQDYEYVYTHDRNSVVAAARCFLQEVNSAEVLAMAELAVANGS